MRRACKISLKFLTKRKQRKIFALLQSYRTAVNFYIKSLWKVKGKQDAPTLARLKSSRLSQRYRQAALKQAMEMIVFSKRSAKALGNPCTCPIFNGYAVLDSRFAVIEEGEKSFDLIVKLSTLTKRQKIVIPCKKTKSLNKWMKVPGAKIVQGCGLSEKGVILWVELFDLPEKTTGVDLGVDIGVNKLLADSNGKFYGTDFKTIRDNVLKTKKGSKGCRRARTTRNHFINRVVKQLPWDTLKTIGVEDLNGLKTGKKKGRGKSFRRAMIPWTYRQVLSRISNLASENRVRLIKVNPAKTSQTCPICGMVSKKNRQGEKFCCVKCNHKNDSDVVGAQNILVRTLAILRSL